MFIIILISVLSHGKKDGKEKKLKKLVKKATIAFILAVMFGVGWIFGVLGSSGVPEAISKPSQVVFVLVVGTQGILIFFLHPLRSKDAREEWRRWICIITCRSQNNLGQSKKSKSSGPISSTGGTEEYGRRTQGTASSSIATRYGASSGAGAESRRSSDVSTFSDGSTLKSSHRLKIQSDAISQSSTLRSTANALDVLREYDETDGDSSTPHPQSDYAHEFDQLTPSSSPDIPQLEPAIKEMFVIENNDVSSGDDYEEMSFHDSNSSSNEEIRFSPISDSVMFQNLTASDGNDLTTWRTFESANETEEPAETIFYNFEDDM